MSNVHDYGKIIFVGRLNKVYSGDGKGLRGQAVKTSPFHGGNTGSIPVGVSWLEVSENNIWRDSQVVRPRSATPLSPVQIRLTPLNKPRKISVCVDKEVFATTYQ